VQSTNREESTPVQLGNPFGEILAHNADLYLATQARLLDSVQALMQAWLTSTREAVDAARDSVQQMATSKDPGAIFRIQQQWLSNAFRRTTETAAELGNDLSSAGNKARANFEGEARNMRGRLTAVNDGMMTAAGNKPRRKRTAR
jgi:hypothetical protein